MTEPWFLTNSKKKNNSNNILIIKVMKEKVLEILANLRPEFDFTEDVDFIEQGMLDSFDVVSLVSDLDSTFGISIDGVDIVPENFSSVDSIINLLKKNGAQ